MTRYDVPGVKFVGVARRFLAQNDGGFQRLCTACGPVGYKMKIRIPLRVARQVSARCSFFSLQNRTARFGEVALNDFHFVFGLGKLFELVARLQRVSNQQKVLLLRRWPAGRRSQQRKRTSGSDRDVFDPKVRLWVRDNQSLEV